MLKITVLTCEQFRCGDPATHAVQEYKTKPPHYFCMKHAEVFAKEYTWKARKRGRAIEAPMRGMRTEGGSVGTFQSRDTGGGETKPRYEQPNVSERDRNPA